MKLLDLLNGPFAVPRLTRTRMVLALIAAAGADALQLALGPFGWVVSDQVIDVIAMVVTMWAIGFHFFLLPTFVAEALPVVGMLPTWTGCVIAVIALRRSDQRAPSPPPPKVEPTPPANDSHIDI